MTTFSMTMGGFAGASHAGKASIFNRVAALFANGHANKAPVPGIEGLSDHLLEDIGLTRGDVPVNVDAEIRAMRAQIGSTGF